VSTRLATVAGRLMRNAIRFVIALLEGDRRLDDDRSKVFQIHDVSRL
jgi:hypothetical protein